jgi:hypothetical protein
MAALRALVRQLLEQLDRFAEATNEPLLVIAVGLGGFYLSVLVILTLVPSAPPDDLGRFDPSVIDRAGSALPGNMISAPVRRSGVDTQLAAGRTASIRLTDRLVAQ